MTTYDRATLEAQLSALDQETAQRVRHLVVECNASLDLALLAVHETNLNIEKGRAHGSARYKGPGIIALLAGALLR